MTCKDTGTRTAPIQKIRFGIKGGGTEYHNTMNTATAKHNFPRAFAREYVKNGFNGTQAYLALRPHVTYGTAEVSAIRILGNTRTQEAMAEIVADIATPEEVKQVLSDYMRDKDPKVRASSVRAGEIDGKIHGIIRDGNNIQVNVGLGQVNDAVLAALARLETPVAIGEGK